MAKKESRRVKTLSSFMKWAEQFDSWAIFVSRSFK